MRQSAMNIEFQLEDYYASINLYQQFPEHLTLTWLFFTLMDFNVTQPQLMRIFQLDGHSFHRIHFRMMLKPILDLQSNE